MPKYDHPHWGLEFDWFAVDRNERVGIFSAGGYGPVPVSVFDAAPKLDTAGDVMAQLRVVGGCDERPDGEGNFSDWIRAADRGLYGFDWNLWSGPYKRLTTPTLATTLGALPAEVRELADLVHFDLDFALTRTINLEHVGLRVAYQDSDGPGA